MSWRDSIWLLKIYIFIQICAWSKLRLPENLAHTNMDLYDKSIVEYCTGYIVKKVALNQNCDKCFVFLMGQNKGSYELIKFKELYNLLHPRKEFVNVCKLCELEMKKLDSKTMFDPNILKKLTNRVVRCFVDSSPNFFFEMYQNYNHDYSHRYQVLLKIIEKYLIMRLRSLSRLYNEELKKRKLRVKLSKTVLFKNE